MTRKKKSSYDFIPVQFRKELLPLVSDIRLMYRNRMFTQQELADMFDISITTVNRMVRSDPKAANRFQ